MDCSGTAMLEHSVWNILQKKMQYFSVLINEKRWKRNVILGTCIILVCLFSKKFMLVSINKCRPWYLLYYIIVLLYRTGTGKYIDFILLLEKCTCTIPYVHTKNRNFIPFCAYVRTRVSVSHVAIGRYAYHALLPIDSRINIRMMYPGRSSHLNNRKNYCCKITILLILGKVTLFFKICVRYSIRTAIYQ